MRWQVHEHCKAFSLQAEGKAARKGLSNMFITAAANQ
jgi:hypothetical protein